MGTNFMRIMFKLTGGKSRFGNSSGNNKHILINSGNWYGNDTIWRTISDINKIMIYSDKKGKVCNNPQRNFLMLVDGIISGEGQGPLAPNNKPCGLILCGTNPWYIDQVAASLMGFDIDKIPLFSKTNENKIMPNNNKITLNIDGTIKEVNRYDLPNLHFKPPKMWDTVLISPAS